MLSYRKTNKQTKNNRKNILKYVQAMGHHNEQWDITSPRIGIKREYSLAKTQHLQTSRSLREKVGKNNPFYLLLLLLLLLYGATLKDSFIFFR